MATVSARRLPARSLLSIMVAFALMACSGDSTNDATDVSIDRGGGGGTDATAPDVGTEDGAATDTAGDTAPTPDTSTDAGVDAVADTGSDAASDASGACGVLPDYGAPAQSGVAYVGHFASPELRWYRTDGDTPTHGGSIDLASFAHDMVLDPVADLLAVAHDVTSEVVLYGLDRPTDPASDIAAPSRITAFGLGEDTPRVLASDPARERLFVGATPPVDGGLLEDMRLYTYDVSDPGAPTPIGDALVIPVVTTIAVDANYGLLFLVDFTTQDLVMYDVSGDGPVALPGDPINLRALYPQESSTGFQVRNLQVDADNGRVLAARAEGPNSEVIAFSYPSAGASAAACPPAPGYADLTMIADGFDIDIPPTDRDNLLGGYVPLPVAGRDFVLFVADAWNGTGASAIAIGLDASLQPVAGCGDFAGIGCLYRSYSAGTPSTHVRTDGAACVDATHDVLVGTSVDSVSEDDPGQMHFFRFDDSLGMSPWNDVDGDTLVAGAFPVAAVCH